jgi:hypothetical protein
MENSSILFPYFGLLDMNDQQKYNLLEENSNNSIIMNDYMQQQIFEEIRRNNTEIEILRHFLLISGSIISLFGIFGTLLFYFHLIISQSKYI